jgi:hypothetical protein
MVHYGSMIHRCLFLLFTILENNIHVRILYDIFNEHGDQAFWNLFFFFGGEGFALLREVTQPSMIRFHLLLLSCGRSPI